MVQQHRTAADPVPANGDDIDDWHDYHLQGTDTACSQFYGTADPSAGASWGANQLGYLWLDSNNEINGSGDDLGPVLKRWSMLTDAPTYGWRTLNARKYVALEPNVNALTLADQSTLAFTDLDLLAVTSSLAISAIVQVQCEDSGTPATGVYTAMRKNGTTTDANARKTYPQVADIPVTSVFIVELDASQVCEYDINASGAGTFDLRVDVLGYYERA